MQNSLKTTDQQSAVNPSSGPPQKQQRRCPFCGQIAELVWVHGHGQCSACGINAEECCRGETCSN